MLAAVANPHTDVLGHCTGRLVRGGRGTRPPSQFDAEVVFAACAEHGVAVEINSRPERADPPDELIDLALAAGCLFAIDSDAHATDQWWYAETALAHARLAGIPTSRIINCWPLAQLLDWARRLTPGEDRLVC
jgi:putative hydrolase